MLTACARESLKDLLHYLKDAGLARHGMTGEVLANDGENVSASAADGKVAVNHHRVA